MKAVLTDVSVFPPLWLIGASAMCLPPGFYSSDDALLKYADETRAHRKQELYWARCCLAAFVFGSIAIVGALLIILS